MANLSPRKAALLYEACNLFCRTNAAAATDTILRALMVRDLYKAIFERTIPAEPWLLNAVSLACEVEESVSQYMRDLPSAYDRIDLTKSEIKEMQDDHKDACGAEAAARALAKAMDDPKHIQSALFEAFEHFYGGNKTKKAWKETFTILED